MGFEQLDDTIATHTADALRDGRPADLTDELNEQMLAREKSRMAFAGADAAQQRLSDEFHDARSRFTVRRKAVDIAIGRLFGVPADGLVRDIRRFEAEIERRLSWLLGYDAFCASLGRDVDLLHPAWRDIYLARASGRSGSTEQLSVWTDAAAKLCADPMAAIEIADPPAPTPRPHRVIQTPHVAAVLAQQARDRAREAQPETPPPETTA